MNSSYTYTAYLNDLNSSTTYELVILVGTACSGFGTPGGTVGSFTTFSAPTTGFVGWVYSQAASLSPWQLNPVNARLSGAVIAFQALCPTNNSISLSPPYWLYTPTVVHISAATTDSNGHYSVSFPLSYVWSSPAGQGNQLLQLWSTGWCSYTYALHAHTNNVTNSHYTFVVSPGRNGFWNVTRNVSSTLGSTNDFQQFIIQPNDVINEPVGLALIHTTFEGVNYNNAECGTEYTQGSTTSTVTSTYTSLTTQFFGLTAGSSVGEEGTSGSSWSAPGVWGQDTGLELGFTFSGIASDSNLNSPENGVGVGSNSGSSIQGGQVGPYTTTEWLAAPPAYNGTWDRAYQYLNVAPEYNSSVSDTPVHTVFASGQWTQASEVEATISAPIEWAGVTGSLSFKLGFTTSVSTSLGWTEGCNFFNPVSHAPNQELYALFYYVDNDTAVASTFVHVWFMGWCANQSGQGYAVCPGD